jgi:hypothetical protein
MLVGLLLADDNEFENNKMRLHEFNSIGSE